MDKDSECESSSTEHGLIYTVKKPPAQADKHQIMAPYTSYLFIVQTEGTFRKEHPDNTDMLQFLYWDDAFSLN